MKKRNTGSWPGKVRSILSLAVSAAVILTSPSFGGTAFAEEIPEDEDYYVEVQDETAAPSEEPDVDFLAVDEEPEFFFEEETEEEFAESTAEETEELVVTPDSTADDPAEGPSDDPAAAADPEDDPDGLPANTEEESADRADEEPEEPEESAEEAPDEAEAAEESADGAEESADGEEAGDLETEDPGAFSDSADSDAVYAGDGTGPETALIVRQEEETVVVGGGEADNDALFEAYLAEEVFHLAGAPADYSNTRLSGADAVIYQRLREYISEVAAGTRTSTEFEIPVEEMGFEATEWTAVELGVEEIITNGAINGNALEAVAEKIPFDFDRILSALLSDCPYELYWYDKTVGCRIGKISYYARYSDEKKDVVLGVSGSYPFSFTVDSGYSAGEDYTVDPGAVLTAQAAAANAEDIVDSHAARADFEKLTAYKEEICSLVSYNDAAAAGNADSGNPWQLVWVFDRDPSTNCVCEGYSKAFQYLFSLSSFRGSLDCRLVSGEMGGGTGSGPHMWNIVRMEDQKNYLVDVTNCDAGSIGADDLLFLAGTAERDERSGYVFDCGGSRVTYQYDDETLAYYRPEELALAEEKYTLGEEDPDYFTIEDGVLVSYSGPGGEVVIPDGVTGIGRGVFVGGDVTSVVIPNGVKRIEARAFESCSGLTSVTFPEGLEFIGKDAFFSCVSLTDVTIPDGLTTIGIRAFWGCTGLTAVSLPESLRNLGQAAFSECSSLTSFTIPDGLTKIEANTFSDCTGLTSVTIPDSVTSIGDDAFSGCTDLVIHCSSDAEYVISYAENHSIPYVTDAGSVKDIALCDVQLDGSSFTYSGERIEPAVSVRDGGAALEKDTDYLVSYQDNTDAGEAKVLVEGTGAYGGTVEKMFVIEPASVEDAEVAGLSAAAYTGSAVTQTPVVKLGTVTLEEGTDYTVTYKNNKNVGLASVTITGTGNYTGSRTAEFRICFRDVPMTHSFHKAVYWAADEKITTGYSGARAGLFGVNDDITRGQVVTSLWKIAGNPAPAKNTQTFKDVPTTHSFYKAIQWAVEQGITSGYSNGKFGPNDNCTRGQIATFLWKYAGKKAPAKNTQTFSDVPTTHSFYKAVQWAVEQGITSGFADGSFGVTRTCTRGQCVTFLYKMLR